jgi:VIT1/CCC1 family predicted Fe2+/Mn2+ transporter
VIAGIASFVAFSIGALIPLAPYVVGVNSLVVALALTAMALITGGMLVGRITGRPLIRAAARQLLLGTISVAVTFAVGRLIGAPTG